MQLNPIHRHLLNVGSEQGSGVRLRVSNPDLLVDADDLCVEGLMELVSKEQTIGAPKGWTEAVYKITPAGREALKAAT